MEGIEKTTLDIKQPEVIADTAGAEKEKAAEMKSGLNLGKFKTAGELHNAYTALEKEFTRKCQELSCLRKQAVPESDKKDNANTEKSTTDISSYVPEKISVIPDNINTCTGNAAKAIDDALILKEAVNNERVKQIIISQYLKSVKTDSIRLMGDADHASFVITPPKKPRTIKEAGDIAKKIFR